MSVTALSSNWKQLQQKLAKEPKKPVADSSKKQPQQQKSKSEANGTERSSKSLKRKADDSHHGTAQDTRNKQRRVREMAKVDGAQQNGVKRSKSFVGRARGKEIATEEAPSRPSTSLSHHEIPTGGEENEGVSPTALAGKYIALDCEMVGVGPTPDHDSQLARVSLVNFHGEQIYDTYVTPKLPVTDYRTAVSGIRPHHMTIGRPFKEVQRDVETFMQGRILVGHYLKSDLTCLQLKHPRSDIRDSSRIQKFRDMNGGRAPKLQFLAKEILGLEIQSGEHNSVEDARAAMMIYKAEKEVFESEGRKGVTQPQAGGPRAPGKPRKKRR